MKIEARHEHDNRLGQYRSNLLPIDFNANQIILKSLVLKFLIHFYIV
jgi:hypothetical protein